MRRVPLAALLRVIIIAGGANFVNPYVSEDRVDLNQVWVEIPSTLVALGGDVHIRVHGTSGGGLKVRIAREDDDGRALLATMPLALDSENRMTLPCGYFSRGGTYYLELISDKDPYLPDYDNTTEVKRNVDNKVKRDVSDGSLMETGDSVVKSWKFDVMWPTANLDVTPEQIQTYPERQVMALLEFPRVVCTPIESSADFWLELLYCGHSSGGAVLCDGKNTSSHAHVLYSEQMHGFPGRRTMTLRCELFGQAGDYALTLRPAAAAGPQDLATAFIKADWSEQFVLNVHGGSVFPCGDGVRVLFQYPECVLEGADRVRVFGRDADRLRYVAERRVRRGQHTASFDCRLFSERYPEYCFVYVSQAVTGAVADVRMDCLPTLPLSADGGAGGWGAWSAWSACPAPAHCSTRTRSRHRFCDSPPPAYGAKLCELADCNRKLARLRSAVEEYEARIEELQNDYKKLDEDRADIIAYLKRTLSAKSEENIELKEKVKGLEEIRQIENERFNQTTHQLEKDFVFMKDQLTSENKLLAGKLNTLEEFRAIRDDLMRKFENQEQEFKDQEMKYKRLIYEAEKKFIIGKDNLKKEMEARLLQLAQDFQDATELRVAASTHRVIRENIAINNELENILNSQAKLADQNESFKHTMRAAQVCKELAEEERDEAINKSVVQLKVIEQLTTAYEKIKKEKALFERKTFNFEGQQEKIKRLTKENDNLGFQVRILEQNLHARLSDQNKAVVEAAKMSKERDLLKKILKDAAFAIQAALKLDKWASTEESMEVMDRHVLLSHLLEIISQFRELDHSESVGTIGSFSKIYEEGDLGFVPKPTKKKTPTVPSIPSAVFSTKEGTVLTEEAKTSLASDSHCTLESSMDTMPSIKVLPPNTQKELVIHESIESFVSSFQSEEIVVEEEEQVPEDDDIEKKLAASKVEMQKSLMKDLAISQMIPVRSETTVAKERMSIAQLRPGLVSAEKPEKDTGAEKMEIPVKLENLDVDDGDDDNNYDDDEDYDDDGDDYTGDDAGDDDKEEGVSGKSDDTT
uniref:Cilia- and flagella-associated protein 157 n=1 Tax=Heliothis virescens TaxID=7102 RepID=A0A2A4JLI4_HELVI